MPTDLYPEFPVWSGENGFGGVMKLMGRMVSHLSWLVCAMGAVQTLAAEAEFSSEGQFGYFLQRDSTAGSSNLGGTGVIMDFNRHGESPWRWGLRTMAYGAIDPAGGGFSRLGAGGHGAYDFAKSWEMKAGGLYLQEELRRLDQVAVMGDGYGLYLQVQRYVEIMPGLQGSFGSLFVFTSTRLELPLASAEAIPRSPSSSSLHSIHRAFTQAVTFSLRVVL